MTTPTNGSEQGFRPDAEFAVIAQQEEINRLRLERDALADRLVWQRAVNIQLQTEANNEIGRLSGLLEAERESQRAEAEMTVPGAQETTAGPDGPFPAVPDAPTGPLPGDTVSLDPPAVVDPAATTQINSAPLPDVEHPEAYLDDDPGEHRRPDSDG